MHFDQPISSYNTCCWEPMAGGLGDSVVTCIHQGSFKTFVTFISREVAQHKLLERQRPPSLPPTPVHLDSHHTSQNTMGNDFNSTITPQSLAVQSGVPSVREGICQWTKGRGHFDNPPDPVHGYIQTGSSLNGEYPVKLQRRNPSIQHSCTKEQALTVHTCT